MWFITQQNSGRAMPQHPVFCVFQGNTGGDLWKYMSKKCGVRGHVLCFINAVLTRGHWLVVF